MENEMEMKYFAIDPKTQIIFGFGKTYQECLSDALEFSDDCNNLIISKYETNQNWFEYDPICNIIEIQNGAISYV